jgi:hypothetical protein
MLLQNGFTGPILSSIMALTRLAYLCAPPRRAVFRPPRVCE